MNGQQNMTDIAKRLNLTQWSIINGYPTSYDVSSHVQAGLRSAPTSKTYHKWYYSEIERLNKLVILAKNKYTEEVEKGLVINPDNDSRIDKLMRTAQGHPDNESVQAAIRILKKRYGIDFKK